MARLNGYFRLQTTDDIYIERIKIKGLVEVIGQNLKEKSKSKESNLKIGIKTIRKNLENKGVQIKNKQIKHYINFNRFNVFRHKSNIAIIKIPYSAYLIFKEIHSIVHQDQNSKILTYCNNKIVNERNTEYHYCKQIMTPKLFELLLLTETDLKEKNLDALHTLKQFENCKLECIRN